MPITFITGANKGLGYETARRLVAPGHTVLLGARDPARGRAAADQLGARFVPVDVADDASVARAAADVAAHEGRVDVLINNAGISGGRRPAEEAGTRPSRKARTRSSRWRPRAPTPARAGSSTASARSAGSA